jgi:hypothetical protein
MGLRPTRFDLGSRAAAAEQVPPLSRLARARLRDRSGWILQGERVWEEAMSLDKDALVQGSRKSFSIYFAPETHFSIDAAAVKRRIYKYFCSGETGT